MKEDERDGEKRKKGKRAMIKVCVKRKRRIRMKKKRKGQRIICKGEVYEHDGKDTNDKENDKKKRKRR